MALPAPPSIGAFAQLQLAPRLVRVEWLLACGYAEMAGDGTLSILGAGQDIYFVPDEALPATPGTFLAVRIAGGEDEWIGGQEHRFALKVVHPDDLSEEDLLEVPLQVDEFPPLKLPGDEVVMTIPVVVQFEARSHGEHGIQAFIDDVRSDAVVNISIRQPAELEGQSREADGTS